ncbi:hydantoinase B/oxoprolinase family protein [Roseobacter sp.]|uniref:hydantoinase B/oxoprolinase family protein n=1 Tax=Roseobacter sp. TaxID=1907202 RepID=UPI0038587E79
MSPPTPTDPTPKLNRMDGLATIRMGVIQERLLAVAEDVGQLLIRGAFSTNIKERRDCSTAIFDAAGRLIAQADHMPIHIGSLLWGLRALLARYPLQEIVEGDAFVMNDPYLAGGTHLPDISVLTPVFVAGRITHFIGNIAHHADVGGPVAGSVSGQSPDIFWEGIRLPPIRIARAGVPELDVIDLIAANTRAPTERQLDLTTQVGSNARGVALLQAVIAECGVDEVAAAGEAIIAHTGARIRAGLRHLKDGHWTATRYLDDDGAGSDPVPLCVTATIKGDHLTLDFAGSGPQAKGAVNLSASSLEATVAYCIKALIDPQVAANGGLLDAVEIRAPHGSIVSPKPPAAVAARAVTSNRLAGAIFDALGPALPENRRMAASNDSTSLVVFSGKTADGLGYVYPESIGGGAGAMTDCDGMDAVHVHTVNSTNLPIEVLETSYPLRCARYALVSGSGGAGRHCGGLGIAREVAALEDGTQMTLRSDGHLFPAPGAAGGRDGSVTQATVIGADGNETELASKSSLTLNKGDRLVIETLGGAGYGDPAERAPSDLCADLLDQRITLRAARTIYGTDAVDAALGTKDE